MLKNIATQTALTCLRFLSLCPLDFGYRAYHPQLELVLLMSIDFGGGGFLKPWESLASRKLVFLTKSEKIATQTALTCLRFLRVAPLFFGGASCWISSSNPCFYPPREDPFWWRRVSEAENVTRMLIAGVSRIRRRGTITVVLLALWRIFGVVKGGGAVHHHRVLRREVLSHLCCQHGKIRGNVTRSRGL